MKTYRNLLIAMLALLFCVNQTKAQSTAFTYQGRLNNGANPANGSYDLTFGLFNVFSGAGQVGTTQTNTAVAVSNGVFTVALDFGANFPGADRWLEIGVRTNTVGAFTTLAPRQKITPTPYAIFATSADAATSVGANGVNSSAILDGSIVNADINASAAIADTKLATISTSGKVANSATTANSTPAANSIVARDASGNFSANTITASFSGNGANLTSLNASQLAFGTVPLAVLGGITSNQLNAATWQLATNLNGGNAAFASNVIAGINITNAFITNSTFAGNGAGLTNLNATQITGTLTSAQLGGTYGNTLTFNNPGNSFTGNGGGLTNVNAVSLNGVNASNFWRLDGNNVAANQFLGSTNNLPLELKVNGARALRLEPNATSPNVVGGYSGNIVSNGFVGAVIAGGGQLNNSNRVGGSFSTVGGGYNNLAYFGSATVAGGDNNLAAQDRSTVSGGFSNRATGLLSAVGGGDINLASGQAATVPGGSLNEAAAAYAFAAGRRAKATNQGAFVWADSQNADFASTADNQFLIRAAGGVGIGTTNPITTLDVAGTARATSFIGNGAGLTNVNALTFGGLTGNDFWRTTGNAGTTAGTNFLGTTDNQPLEVKVNGQRVLKLEASPYGPPNIVGGLGSQGSSDSVAGGGNTIGGGATNQIADGLSAYNTISGGLKNHIDDSGFTTISGGNANSVSDASLVVIGGGQSNEVRNFAGIIGGGSANAVWGQYGIIAGGESNFLYSYSSSIGGGSGNGIDGYADFARISGGLNNWIRFDAARATIGGGIYNTIGESANSGMIGGGNGNTIHSNAGNATIGGGFENGILDSASSSTIGGGFANRILTNGVFATIPGGYFNTATNYAFAAGRRAKAIHSGAFVWGDSTDADVSSTAPNQFLVRASGGVGINTASPQSPLHVAGDVRVEGLTRAGSQTGTAEVPDKPLLVRRIKSTANTAGSVVARTDKLTLERDGSNAGWRIVNGASPGNTTIAATGLTASGATVNFVTSISLSAAAGTTVIFTDAQNVVSFRCSFGDNYGPGNQSEVSLSRYPGDFFWTGTLTSTFNQ